MAEPRPIPAPAAVFSNDEWAAIQRGYRSGGMDDKWDVDVVDQVLHATRSWTGKCIYEARFAPVVGGWRIVEALSSFEFDIGSDETRSLELECIIRSRLLGTVPEDLAARRTEKLVARSPGYEVSAVLHNRGSIWRFPGGRPAR